MAGIYIHIPFCKQACHYCDFHFSTNTNLMESVIDSIVKEIEIQQNYLPQQKIDTLYFGGGTPSLLNKEQLERIISAVKKYFILAPDGEFTMEANPDDLTKDKLLELKALGVNRLSIGIQTFDNRLLKYFNRAHDHQMATDSVKMAQAVGFKNISLDLIFGAPNQSLDDLNNDLKQALALNTTHISIYGLTIEEKTVFGKWHKQNKLVPLDEDLAANHFTTIMDQLEQAGMVQYEISNFCQPGFESRHNSSYWKGKPYLGIGPSAHSYNDHSRQFNVSNNLKYINSLANDMIPFTLETLTAEDVINEMIMIQLRTIDGLDLKFLRNRLMYDIEVEKKDEIKWLIDEHKIVIESEKLQLTRDGKLIADYITEKLMI